MFSRIHNAKKSSYDLYANKIIKRLLLVKRTFILDSKTQISELKITISAEY